MKVRELTIHGRVNMQTWWTPALLGVLAALLALNFLFPSGGVSVGRTPEPSAWSVGCGGGMCVALDGDGNSYWGLREDGAAGSAFRWYVAGNVRDAQPYGVAACRERIQRFDRDRAALEERLAKLNAPAKPAADSADAMDAARQNMLSKLERLDTQKALDKLMAEQGPAAAECRALLEGR